MIIDVQTSQYIENKFNFFKKKKIIDFLLRSKVQQIKLTKIKIMQTKKIIWFFKLQK